MNAGQSAISLFVRAWLAEFSRAVEMFHGEQPEIRHIRTEAVSIPQAESSLWLRQVFVGCGTFETWIGAQEATWTSLGRALGEDSSEAVRSTFLEIVNQAQQGSASVMNSSFAKAIHCETAERLVPGVIGPSQFAIFEIDLVGAGIPPLALAVELSVEQVLGTNPSVKAVPSVAMLSEQSSPSMVASRLDVKLPVSVSLGKSELAIKDVLRDGPGSVITLNKRSSEFVELLVQGRVVAQGEVVLVEGNFAFRVKQIVSRQDRSTMRKRADRG